MLLPSVRLRKVLPVKRRIKGPLLILVLLAVLYPQHSRHTSALSCEVIYSVEMIYEKYDGVILAKVQKVSREKDDSNQVRVQVLKSYKGVTDASLTLTESSGFGSFWGLSEKGQTYLFYLKKNETGWENPLCSPTLKQGDAVKELAFLEGKELPLNGVSEPSGTSGGTVWLVTSGALCLSGLLGYGIYRRTRPKAEYK
ncbi:hypothetical protein D3C75_673950 [compost metagenome]